MAPLRSIAALLALGLSLAVGGQAHAAKTPAPDRLTASGSSVVLGWEAQELNPAAALELEWILQRKDLKVLTWGMALGGFTDDGFGAGAHVTTAVSRHWHTWRGVYAGVRGGVGLQVLAPGAMLQDLGAEDPTGWDLVARIPVGVEVGWQHPARGWRAGLRAEQVVWAPYAWKLETRVGVQSSVGVVVSVPLFWKNTAVRD